MGLAAMRSRWMADGTEILYDKDIREPLFVFLEETYGKTRILEEKRTGSARADAVMVTPEILYGIKAMRTPTQGWGSRSKTMTGIMTATFLLQVHPMQHM